MASNGASHPFNRLIFPKDPKQHGVWKDLILGHLRQKSGALAREATMKGKTKLAFKYEDLLVTRCEVPRPMGDEIDPEAEEEYEWQQVLLEEQDTYIRGLLNQTLPRGYLESLRVSFNDEDLPTAWQRLETDFGQSTAQGMVQLMGELDQALSMDFNSVGQLIQGVKEARNRIIRLSRKLMNDLELVPNEYVAFKVLSLFPSQYWGNQIDIKTGDVTLEKVEAILRNVFMDKSKRQIQALQAKPVQVNHVKASKHLGKRKERQPEAKKLGNCFYCDGRYNVDGKPHRKVDCPKMLQGWMRSSIFVEGRHIDVNSVGVAATKKGKQKRAERVEVTADAARAKRIKAAPVAAVQTKQRPISLDTLSPELAQTDLDSLMTSPAASPVGSSEDAHMSEIDDVGDFGIPGFTGVLSEASSNVVEGSIAVEKKTPGADTA